MGVGLGWDWDALGEPAVEVAPVRKSEQRHCVSLHKYAQAIFAYPDAVVISAPRPEPVDARNLVDSRDHFDFSDFALDSAVQVWSRIRLMSRLKLGLYLTLILTP